MKSSSVTEPLCGEVGGERQVVPERVAAVDAPVERQQRRRRPTARRPAARCASAAPSSSRLTGGASRWRDSRASARSWRPRSRGSNQQRLEPHAAAADDQAGERRAAGRRGGRTGRAARRRRSGSRSRGSPSASSAGAPVQPGSSGPARGPAGDAERDGDQPPARACRGCSRRCRSLRFVALRTRSRLRWLAPGAPAQGRVQLSAERGTRPSVLQEQLARRSGRRSTQPRSGAVLRRGLLRSRSGVVTR